MTELDNIIDSLRALGASDIGSRIAKRAESHVLSSLQATLSAGESPEGAKWADRKKGGRAYANAASRVAVKSSGDILRVILSGPEVYGQFGASGITQRQMIPDAGAEIPGSVAVALTKAAGEVFAEVTR